MPEAARPENAKNDEERLGSALVGRGLLTAEELHSCPAPTGGPVGPRALLQELVEGRTIQEDLAAGKVFQEKEALEIVVQIAQALSHAGRRGLIHRDVKPANIVRTGEGIAKLADLGMARAAGDVAAVQREKGL